MGGCGPACPCVSRRGRQQGFPARGQQPGGRPFRSPKRGGPAHRPVQGRARARAPGGGHWGCRGRWRARGTARRLDGVEFVPHRARGPPRWGMAPPRAVVSLWYLQTGLRPPGVARQGGACLRTDETQRLHSCWPACWPGRGQGCVVGVCVRQANTWRAGRAGVHARRAKAGKKAGKVGYQRQLGRRAGGPGTHTKASTQGLLRRRRKKGMRRVAVSANEGRGSNMLWPRPQRPRPRARRRLMAGRSAGSRGCGGCGPRTHGMRRRTGGRGTGVQGGRDKAGLELRMGAPAGQAGRARRHTGWLHGAEPRHQPR